MRRFIYEREQVIHMKFAKLLLIVAIAFCFTSANADAQAFSKYNVTNPTGSTTFYGISNSKNTKIYKGKDWLYKVTSISFSKSAAGTAGMAFAPMKKSSLGIYSLCGGVKSWASAPMSKYVYKGWNSGAGAVGDYYLGTRLDTVLTNCTASAAGDWNAN